MKVGQRAWSLGNDVMPRNLHGVLSLLLGVPKDADL